MAEAGARDVLGVRIAGLRDFATFLDRELRAHLDPGVEGIRTDAGHGLNWGTGVDSALVRRIRSRYVESQEAALRNLSGYLWAGRALRELIQQLMQNYRTTEDLAQLTTDDVLDLFSRLRAQQLSTVAGRAVESAPSPQTGRVLPFG